MNIKLKAKNKKRLAKLAIELLKNSYGNKVKAGDRTLDFNMETYCARGNNHNHLGPDQFHCGTSCCFVGYAPNVFPVTRKMDDWDQVVEHIIGLDPYSQKGDKVFITLFDMEWPNDPKLAACRALKVLKDGVDENISVRNFQYNKNYPKETLLKELAAFA